MGQSLTVLCLPLSLPLSQSPPVLCPLLTDSPAGRGRVVADNHDGPVPDRKTDR